MGGLDVDLGMAGGCFVGLVAAEGKVAAGLGLQHNFVEGRFAPPACQSPGDGV